MNDLSPFMVNPALMAQTKWCIVPAHLFGIALVLASSRPRGPVMLSPLIIPASTARIEQAMNSDADALVLDLVELPAEVERDNARRIIREALFARQNFGHAPLENRPMIVQVNALTSPHMMADLEAIMPVCPDVIMLPACRNGADIQHMGARLAVHEATHNLPDGQTRIIPVIASDPASLFELGSIAGASSRLLALTWDVSALMIALKSRSIWDENGSLTDPYRLARSLVLFAAVAARVPALDAPCANDAVLSTLQRVSDAAKRDGFAGKIALHTAHIAPIRHAFAA